MSRPGRNQRGSADQTDYRTLVSRLKQYKITPA